MPESLLTPDVVQFHVLTILPPHNVNRDEDGRPKTCQFGGTMRGRISSQAKKRALRFAPHFPKTQRATRTREAGIQAFRTLRKAGIDAESAAWVALAVNFALGGGDKAPPREEATELVKPSKKKDADERARLIEAKMNKTGCDQAAAETLVLEMALGTDQGLVVSSAEFAGLSARLEALIDTFKADAAGFPAGLEAWVKETCKQGLLSQTDRDLDTALFGRMVAAKPEFNVEAACAVSHAFTTHRFSVEGDYFSAGEELNELGGTGAAITSYAFFGGGVYYQHAVLDRAHLRQNLAGEEQVTQAVGLLLDGLLFAQPKGKRNSHASDVGASYVLATRGADPALNLGLAFLEPVTPGDDQDRDLMKASIARLGDFYDKLRAAYDLRNAVCRFNAYPAAYDQQPSGDEVRTLAALRDFVGAGA